MKLKDQKEIDAAMQKHQGKVEAKRAQELVSHVRSTRPEKMDELDAIFSEHLPEGEKAFYRDIVSGGAMQSAVTAAAAAAQTTSREQPGK
jgi:hypothetical protein